MAKSTKVKNKLSAVVDSGPMPVSNKDMERERRYQAERGLQTLSEADKIKKDKGLMKDIKGLAKQQLKAACK